MHNCVYFRLDLSLRAVRLRPPAKRKTFFGLPAVCPPKLISQQTTHREREREKWIIARLQTAETQQSRETAEQSKKSAINFVKR